MPITRDSCVVVSDEQVSTSLGDETVILGMDDGVYYGLDAVGARVWALVASPRRGRTSTLAAKVAVAATLALAAGGLGVLAGSLGDGPGAPEQEEPELVFLTPDDVRDMRPPRELQEPPRPVLPGPRLGGV